MKIILERPQSMPLFYIFNIIRRFHFNTYYYFEIENNIRLTFLLIFFKQNNLFSSKKRVHKKLKLNIKDDPAIGYFSNHTQRELNATFFLLTNASERTKTKFNQEKISRQSLIVLVFIKYSLRLLLIVKF